MREISSAVYLTLREMQHSVLKVFNAQGLWNFLIFCKFCRLEANDCHDTACCADLNLLQKHGGDHVWHCGRNMLPTAEGDESAEGLTDVYCDREKARGCF